MALSKRELRALLNPLVGEDWPVLTTANGNAGGSTFEDTRYNGADANFFVPWWVLDNHATVNTSKYAPITAVSSTDPKTFTLTPAFGVQITSSTALELHQWRPDLHTKAINRAIIMAAPWLWVGAMDSSLTVLANTYQYTLPAGYTPDNIVKVMIEGEGDFDEIPVTTIPHAARSWSPDGTKMWWGRGSRSFAFPTTGLKIYLMRRNPLTALAVDSTYGVLTNDTTAVVELTAGSPQVDLLIMFARAAFYELLASEPAVANKKAMLDLAAGYLQMALRDAPGKAMADFERDEAYS